MRSMLTILGLLLITSCSYNINNSVGGNVTTTTTGNTFRGSTGFVPTVINRPFISTPSPALISSYCYTPPFYAYGWYRPWGRFWW